MAKKKTTLRTGGGKKIPMAGKGKQTRWLTENHLAGLYLPVLRCCCFFIFFKGLAWGRLVGRRWHDNGLSAIRWRSSPEQDVLLALSSPRFPDSPKRNPGQQRHLAGQSGPYCGDGLLREKPKEGPPLEKKKNK